MVNPATQPKQMNDQQKLHQLKAIATLMDSQFKGPFGIRFGADAIVGLVPFLGDLVATVFSVYLLTQSAALGCSSATVLRMALNIAVDNLISAVPLFGNIFDLMWKSNNKNIALLEEHLKRPKAVTLKSRLVIGGVILVLLSLLTFTGVVTVFAVRNIFEWLRDVGTNPLLGFS